MNRVFSVGLLLIGTVFSAHGSAWEVPSGLRLHLNAANEESLELGANGEVLVWQEQQN